MKIESIQVGDKVKFISSNSEMYPYWVPETDEVGKVRAITIHRQFQLLMGIELEMALVRFEESNMDRLIYLEDLIVIERGSSSDFEEEPDQEYSVNSMIN